MEFKIMISIYFVFEVLTFIGLIIFSKYYKGDKNNFVGFRTKYSMINEQTFKYGNDLFNTYNVYVCLYLLLFSVVCFVVAYLFVEFYYIIYLPTFLLIFIYTLLIININNKIKRKFNL